MDSLCGKTIVFFAYNNSFSYYNIGGTDSNIRRLANKLIDDGNRVCFVHYGCENENCEEINSIFSIRNFQNLVSALEFIASESSNVISIYLRKQDRLKYAIFRKKNNNILFHHYYFTWPENTIRRYAMTLDSKLVRFSGVSFCVSGRLNSLMQRRKLDSILLLPPVPSDYFLDLKCKDYNPDIIRVAFLGRVDIGKGILEAVDLLRLLNNEGGYDCLISGFPWLNKSDTVKIHNELLLQNDIKYLPVQYEQWSPAVCAELRDKLKNIDILILPYKQLSSTIDMPLLLLEAMANLCVVITPNIGDMHEVYGESCFNLPGSWDTDVVLSIITQNKINILQERERVYKRCQDLYFDTQSIYDLFKRHIKR